MTTTGLHAAVAALIAEYGAAPVTRAVAEQVPAVDRLEALTAPPVPAPEAAMTVTVAGKLGGPFTGGYVDLRTGEYVTCGATHVHHYPAVAFRCALVKAAAGVLASQGLPTEPPT